MRNALAVAAVVLLGAACGAYHFPGDAASPAATAHVSGTVLSVPCAPVERADSPCPGRPVAKVELDYVAGDAVASRAVTNANGVYAVDLKPGSYEVRLVTYMRVISGPTKLTVGAGERTVANYLLDNGIRVPVPQQ